MRLLIVRHGKTDWNELGLVQGTTDIEINELGIKETLELKKLIVLDEIDICISSPLKRTRKTTEILIENKKDVIYDESIVERYCGDLEGKKIDFELVKKLWDYKLNYSLDNVECLHNLLDRTSKFLKRIKEEYNDKSILIVTHAGVLKAIHFNIIGYDENTDFLSFYPSNSALYEYNI